MANLVGRPIRAVSIEPTARWSGVCINGTMKIRPEELERLALPAPFLPARLRRQLEGDVLISLAGPIGAELAGFESDAPAARIGREPDYQQAEAACALLSRSERAHLERSAAREGTVTSDEEDAGAMAFALAGSQLAAVTLGYLRQVCRSIVYEDFFIRRVQALAAELLEHKTIGGRRARQVLRQADVAT